MHNAGLAESLNETAKMENISRARVTQIMDLMMLPVEGKGVSDRSQEPAKICSYSERRLCNSQTSKVMPEERNNQEGY